MLETINTYEFQWEPIGTKELNNIEATIKKSSTLDGFKAAHIVNLNGKGSLEIPVKHGVECAIDEKYDHIEVTTYRSMNKVKDDNGEFHWISDPYGMLYHRVTKIFK